MKQFKLWSILLVSLAFLLTSCNTSNGYEPKNPIYKVTATSDIKFTVSDNLLCSVNGIEYQYTVSGKTVVATPKEGGLVADLILMASNVPAVNIFLINDKIGTGETIDQSTFDKMMHYDVLYGSKAVQADLASEITGITFNHYHSMLSFKCINIPEGATIKVKEGKEGKENNIHVVTPYEDKKNAYMAIATDAPKAQIEVTISGHSYLVTVGDIAPLADATATEFDANYFYTFDIEYHPEELDPSKKITINNAKKVKWLNQHLEPEDEVQ